MGRLLAFPHGKSPGWAGYRSVLPYNGRIWRKGLLQKQAAWKETLSFVSKASLPPERWLITSKLPEVDKASQYLGGLQRGHTHKRS